MRHLKIALLLVICGAVAGVVAVLLWQMFLTGFSDAGEPEIFGWFVFAFISGMLMIATPCTLPLVYVVVPHTLNKGILRGLVTFFIFSVGLVAVLALYGGMFSGLGRAGLDVFGLQSADVQSWTYIFGGLFVFAFAMGELGLFRLHLAPYEGTVPKFIERRKGLAKPFLVGLFLGNIGVGCLHPAIPLLLIEAASRGDVYYGVILLFTHAIGRTLPLLFLILYSACGINPLRAVADTREILLAKAGWLVVFASGLLVTVGLFGTQWWEYSGLGRAMQAVLTIPWVLDVFPVNFLNMGQYAQVGSAFGQPIWWGSWLLVIMWTFPLWRRYELEFRRVFGSPTLELKRLERKAEETEHERRALELAIHMTDGKSGQRLVKLEGEIDVLLAKRAALEEGIRYGAKRGLWDDARQMLEESNLAWRFRATVAITILVVVIFVYYLPVLA